MKTFWPGAGLALLAACACDPPSPSAPPAPPASPDPMRVKNDSLPDWSGPPLQVNSRVDRGIDIVLQAPTAGHSFEVHKVIERPGVATVHLLHRTPGDAFVAQVITPLRVSVEPGQLGAVRRIEIRIATQVGPDEGARAEERLAFVLLRP